MYCDKFFFFIFLACIVVTTFYPKVHTLTVSDLGLPARGAMCPSQQFSEGHFFFFGGGGRGGHYIFFYSNIRSVMLSTNAMFKGELNVQLLSRTSVEVL